MNKTIYSYFLQSGSVTTDTRNIKPGDLFFALKGPNFNGNEYAKEALKHGAIAVVIDQDQNLNQPNVFLVEDVLTTLQELAKHHRQQLNIPVIGITGSNGKTTTKELMRDVLSKKYRVHATHGNLNNHIGVPLTLLSIPLNTEIALIEMGANHKKEIEFLCSICQPTIGYITNFGKAHLEGFGGVEGIIEGKSELYVYLKQNNGTVLCNLNDAIQVEKSKSIEGFTFGKSHADVMIENLTIDQEVILKVESTKITSQLFGSYNFTNASAAVALGIYFNVPLPDIKNAIASYTSTINRSEVRQTDKNKLILDAYNANPTSMELSITSFLGQKKENLVLILGDMFELGDHTDKEHQAIVNLIERNPKKASVILIGQHFRKTLAPDNFSQYLSTEDVIHEIKKNPIVGKTILLKGSRGMKLETLITYL